MRRLFQVAVLLVMVILGIACAPPRTAVKNTSNGRQSFFLHVDKSFNSADRAIILESFMEWERDSRGIVDFALDAASFDPVNDEMLNFNKKCTEDVYVIGMQSTHKTVREVEKTHGGVLAFTMSTCKRRFIVFVMDRLINPVLLRAVGVHEVGHLVGLDHIPVPNESVMFPSVDKAMTCPSTLDMKQFCMLHECDWHDMIRCDK